MKQARNAGSDATNNSPGAQENILWLQITVYNPSLFQQPQSAQNLVWEYGLGHETKHKEVEVSRNVPASRTTVQC